MAGRRSFGAIEKLPSGRYRARYMVDGRWVNAPTAFPSKAEAGIFLDSIRTDMVRGAWKAPRTSRISLDAYGQKWIEQRQSLKATTRREYESCWRNHIGPYIGVHRLDEVTPDMVRDWHAQTQARLKVELEAQDAARLARERVAARGLGKTVDLASSLRPAFATAPPRRPGPTGSCTRCSSLQRRTTLSR